MEKQELAIAKERFVAACDQAKNVSLLQNAASAFEAATVVVGLRNALTPAVVQEVFMPLMNTKIGFLTDKDPAKTEGAVLYSPEVVRDAIIDAASIGLLPIGNQMNIIAGRMYPTKEGYTALLKNMGVKYKIYIATPQMDTTRDHAKMDFSIVYSINGSTEERYASCVSVSVNKNRSGYVVSSEDQLKGKAERRAKKALYEMISGFDFGEAADVDSIPVQDAQYEDITESSKTKAQKSIEAKKRRQAEEQAKQELDEAETATNVSSQPSQSELIADAAQDLPFDEPEPMPSPVRKSVAEQAREINERYKNQTESSSNIG